MILSALFKGKYPVSNPLLRHRIAFEFGNRCFKCCSRKRRIWSGFL